MRDRRGEGGQGRSGDRGDDSLRGRVPSRLEQCPGADEQRQGPRQGNQDEKGEGDGQLRARHGTDHGRGPEGPASHGRGTLRDGAHRQAEGKPVGSLDTVLALLPEDGVHPVHPLTGAEHPHGESQGHPRRDERALEAQIWDDMEAKQMQAKIKEITARKAQNRPVTGAKAKGKGKPTRYNLNDNDEVIEPTAEGQMEEYDETDWSAVTPADPPRPAHA